MKKFLRAVNTDDSSCNDMTEGTGMMNEDAIDD
jgi:hypothetical protein